MRDRTSSGEFKFPTLQKVIYGPGSIARIGEEVDRLGCKRAYLFTGRSIAEKTDYVQKIIHLMDGRLVGVFGDTNAHTPIRDVLEAAVSVRSLDVDLVVSLSGGSPVDAAKMVALCVAERAESHDDVVKRRMRLVDKQPFSPPNSGRAMSHIAVPTTLSAAEFTTYAGCTDERTGEKSQYKHADLAPKVVIQDPELTRATPASLWGSTGMRSVDHCIEALYSKKHHPFSDALAIEALSLLSDSLERSTRDPDDLLAKARCQTAAWLSLYSMSNVVMGLSHAIGHQLGGRCHVPHGVTSCLLLAATMDFNRPFSADRQAIAARAMGIDTRDMSCGEAAAKASNRIRDLVRGIGIADRLRDWQVREEDLESVAEGTMQELLLESNPRSVPDAETVLQILHSVF